MAGANFRTASETPRRKLRYLAALLAKEVVMHSFPAPQLDPILERGKRFADRLGKDIDAQARDLPEFDERALFFRNASDGREIELADATVRELL